MASVAPEEQFCWPWVSTAWRCSAATAQRGRRAGRHVPALRLDQYEWSTHTLPWSWHPSPPPLLVTTLRGGQLGRDTAAPPLQRGAAAARVTCLSPPPPSPFHQRGSMISIQIVNRNTHRLYTKPLRLILAMMTTATVVNRA